MSTVQLIAIPTSPWSVAVSRFKLMHPAYPTCNCSCTLALHARPDLNGILVKLSVPACGPPRASSAQGVSYVYCAGQMGSRLLSSAVSRRSVQAWHRRALGALEDRQVAREHYCPTPAYSKRYQHSVLCCNIFTEKFLHYRCLQRSSWTPMI